MVVQRESSYEERGRGEGASAIVREEGRRRKGRGRRRRSTVAWRRSRGHGGKSEGRRVGDSPGTCGRRGWEGEYRGLPSLGPWIEILLE